MKKILSQFFVLFMFFGIIFTPRIVYAYRHIGIDPSSIKPVTVTFVPNVSFDIFELNRLQTP